MIEQEEDFLKGCVSRLTEEIEFLIYYASQLTQKEEILQKAHNSVSSFMNRNHCAFILGSITVMC